MLENEILLIGLGKNRYKINEILETDNINLVREKYGEDSCFYKAFRIMKRFGREKAYILNLDTWEDIKDQEEILNDLNFDYICPLDLYLDDEYYDDFYNKNLYYSQLILLLLRKTISTMIVTGPHASGFETLDAYLNEELTTINRIQVRASNLKRENLIYVSNNLNNWDYANVVLACVMVNTDYAEYPSNSLLGSAYFDIDYSDIPAAGRLVYFKNNILTGTTIENLVNFSDDQILRLVPVYKIIKYFYFHRANFEQYIGKTYTDYRKLKIEETLEEWLTELDNWIIYKHQINSVTTVQTQLGTVDIILKYDIWPKFTTEVYKMETTL